MPTRPIEYVPQPFVRGQFTPSTATLGDALRRRGQIESDMALSRGQGSANVWAGLALAFNNYQQAVREQKVAEAALAQREQARQDELEERRVRQAEQKAEREATEKHRKVTEDRLAEAADRDARNELAAATQPGVLHPSLVPILEKTGRVRVQDGVPVFLRTPEQVRQADVDAATRKREDAAAAERLADNERAAAGATEQARHNKVMESIAQQNANTAAEHPRTPAKMPAAMAEKVAASQTSLAALDRLETLYKDTYIGPVAGRYNQRERSAPSIPGMNLLPDAPEGFEEFAAETATLKNQIIQAITGAAVGVQEAQRIQAQIPELTDHPKTWKAKAAATRRNLQALMANQVQVGTAAEPLPNGTTVEINPSAGGLRILSITPVRTPK